MVAPGRSLITIFHRVLQILGRGASFSKGFVTRIPDRVNLMLNRLTKASLRDVIPVLREAKEDAYGHPVGSPSRVQLLVVAVGGDQIAYRLLVLDKEILVELDDDVSRGGCSLQSVEVGFAVADRSDGA
jgi:hypothetical protein